MKFVKSFLLSWTGSELKQREIKTQKISKISTYCEVVCAHKRLLFQFVPWSAFEAWFPLIPGLAVSAPYYCKCKPKSQARYPPGKQLKTFFAPERSGR